MKPLGLGRERVKEALKSGKITVTVYGLGKLGLPLAAVLAGTGAVVVGVDVDEEKISMLRGGVNPYPWEPGLGELLQASRERMYFTTDAVDGARRGDFHIIVIPGKIKKGRFDEGPFLELAEKMAEGLEKGDIVITETTLPPGTTESLAPVLESRGLRVGRDLGLAHAPERTSSGTMIRDITRQYPKIVGASDPHTLEAVTGLYEAINEKGVIQVSSIRAAEAVKVFEGVYRDVNIGLANELALYAEKIGIDVYEVIRAANTQPYCNIHAPSAGVGGHCIPVYPHFVLQDFESTIIRAARRVNESMPEHVVRMAQDALNEMGKPIRGSRVLILGIAYRGNVKSLENSPGLEVAKRLREMGARVMVWDPMFEEGEIGELGFEPVGGPAEADLAIILADHRAFRDLEPGSLAPVVVDARPSLEKDPSVLAPGKLVRGVGFEPTNPSGSGS